MNDLDFRKKKSGMTALKAWGLVLIPSVGIFILVIVLAVFLKRNNTAEADSPNQMAKIMQIGMPFLYLISIFLGLKINKFEFPFSKNFTHWKTILISLILGIFAFYFSSIFLELGKFFSKIDKENIDLISRSTFFVFTTTILSFILTFAIIGHGLLRNNKFNVAFLISISLALSTFLPITVLIYSFQNAICLYVYYKTANIFATLITNLVFYIPDMFLIEFGVYKEMLNNNIRFVLIQNDTFYFIGLVIATVGLLACLYYFYKQKTPIEWQLKDEYEPFEF